MFSHFKISILILGIVICTSATDNAVLHVLHESRSVESHWNRLQRLPGHRPLSVKIGLVQRNLDLGHAMLMDMFDSHGQDCRANYAIYYTMEELDELFAPPEADRKAVVKWLESEKIPHSHIAWTPNKQWIHFHANVSTIEQIFKAEYYSFQHQKTGDLSIGCEEYSVPKHVQPLLDYVKPGVVPVGRLKSRQLRPSSSKRTKPALNPDPTRLAKRATTGLQDKNCSELVTVDCYREIYNITDQIKHQSGNAVGIYEAGGQFVSKENLNLFFQEYAPDIPANTYPHVVRIDGAPDPLEHQEPTPEFYPEADLDFQVAYPFVWPDEVILYQVDDTPYENKFNYESYFDHDRGLFNTWLDAMDGSYCNRTVFGITGDSPNIDPDYPDPSNKTGSYKGELQCGRFKAAGALSISYGGDEGEYPSNYLRRQCSEWLKLGLNGTTIAAASGDAGVGPSLRNDCAGPENEAFGPSDTSTCPYVLSVGGSVVVGDDYHEIAMTAEPKSSGFISGGGFSNIFPRPAYQEKTLEKYFAAHNPPYEYYELKYRSKVNESGRYNRIGRGFPDVSAVGRNVAVNFFGNFSSDGGGTSASAPLWAAIITRINNARLAAGKRQVGFINQVLYAHPEVLNDIVEGDNPGCGTKGFECVSGWDPVTGVSYNPAGLLGCGSLNMRLEMLFAANMGLQLGSPNYGMMKELFLSLP